MFSLSSSCYVRVLSQKASSTLLNYHLILLTFKKHNECAFPLISSPYSSTPSVVTQFHVVLPAANKARERNTLLITRYVLIKGLTNGNLWLVCPFDGSQLPTASKCEGNPFPFPPTTRIRCERIDGINNPGSRKRWNIYLRNIIIGCGPLRRRDHSALVSLFMRFRVGGRWARVISTRTRSSVWWD